MHRKSIWLAAIVVTAVMAGAGTAPLPARADSTIIDDWSKAKLPAPPQLKPVTLDPKTTALLVMDFTVQTCTPARRPRCADSVPKVKKFVEAARGKGALIIYSVAVPKSVPGDILKELTPAPGEQVLPPLGPDKFINSDLEKTLHDKGITTVVAMGTQAQTSVLHTGGEAALRGFKVIVPVDAMSADDLFPELYTAWHLSTAARISNQVTLTKLDMIGF
ncbi:MAG TPA: isochorismatase family protein [Xanthobacteraceae bacterium]|nr:isochorismatase family protein [Xanthobacteraceae bacterium]